MIVKKTNAQNGEIFKPKFNNGGMEVSNYLKSYFNTHFLNLQYSDGCMKGFFYIKFNINSLAKVENIELISSTSTNVNSLPILFIDALRATILSTNKYWELPTLLEDNQKRSDFFLLPITYQFNICPEVENSSNKWEVDMTWVGIKYILLDHLIIVNNYTSETK